ncbi:MAG: aldo/keto reductase [Fibrobacterota bacterium]
MNYRTLGRTGLTISEIGLGGLSIGGPFTLGGYAFGRGEVDDKNSLKMTRVALDAGVSLIDTADIYGYGKSEEVLGEALQGRRGNVVVVTKVGNRGDTQEWFKDFSPAWVKSACDNSLRRLRTDYIDVYMLHTPDTDFSFTEEIFAPFNELKKQGKIRFYGCSLATPKQGMEFIASGFGDVMEVLFNVVEREAAEELLPAAEHADMGVMLKQPLAAGLLTGKYNKNTFFDEQDFRKTLYPRPLMNRRVDEAEFLASVADELQITLPQLALKYCLMRKEAASTVPGAKTAGQVLENARASDGVELPVHVLDRIHRTFTHGIVS